MPSKGNAGDGNRLASPRLAQERYADVIVPAARETQVPDDKTKANCVTSDKVDGHEELNPLAPLPPPSSPQGVGGHLPHNTFQEIHCAQVL